LYEWQNSDVCEFHKHRDSAQYGPLSGKYTRVKKDIIEIIDYGGCCNYSGGSSYYNLATNKYMYQSCSCFHDRNIVDKILK